MPHSPDGLVETPVLRTARLVLRRLRLSDVDHLVALNADPGVMRFLSRTPPSRTDVTTEVERLVEDYEQRLDLGTLAAEDLEGMFVGWFGLSIGTDGWAAPELGYRLRRTAWGKGLATEGVRALVDHAFQRPEVKRILAETMAVNVGSRRVLEKCGLKHVGTYHPQFDDPLPGTEQGEVRYEIVRADWDDGAR